jgi:two-component system response regulator RegA
VLLVDDDQGIRRSLRRDFEQLGCVVLDAGGYAEAITLASEHAFDLAVVDLNLGTDSGLDLVESLRAAGIRAPIVVLTGYGSIPIAVDALKLGADDFQQKPTTAHGILESLQKRVRHARGDRAVLPSLERAIYEHLHRALAESNGNVSEAARRLRIPRRTLQRKLRKLPPPQ